MTKENEFYRVESQPISCFQRISDHLPSVEEESESVPTPPKLPSIPFAFEVLITGIPPESVTESEGPVTGLDNIIRLFALDVPIIKVFWGTPLPETTIPL